MNLQPSDVLFGVGLGVGATLVMDAWNYPLKRGLGIPSLNYCFLGRWVLYLPRGVFRHASISAAAPLPRECTVGWMSHYSIGVVLAVTFVVLAPAHWVEEPTLWPALLFGVGTVVFPFFVLQPALGFGLASSRAPKPLSARLKSLATHTVFGVGLFVCALLANELLSSAS